MEPENKECIAGGEYQVVPCTCGGSDCPDRKVKSPYDGVERLRVTDELMVYGPDEKPEEFRVSKFTPFYCPSCEKDSIAHYHSYCPNCGVPVYIESKFVTEAIRGRRPDIIGG